MQSHRFWLLDVVPALAPPFYVLGAPFLGFSSITAPEYTAEIDTIKEVNSMFKKYAYSGGEAGQMTLTRGVRGFDNTMWDWMYRALTGLETTQRHLLLLHFTSISLFHAPDQAAALSIPFSDAIEFLPGQAWLLWNTIPVRYKGASDFDATSGAVSIAELDIQPQAITNFALLDPI
jgi:hypothetical protein